MSDHWFGGEDPRRGIRGRKSRTAVREQCGYVQWYDIAGSNTKWKFGRQLGVYGTRDARVVTDRANSGLRLAHVVAD